MDITQVSAKIRPRNHYEAIDLGTVMARHWLVALCGLWVCASLPIFLLLQLLFPESPYISALVIWWLKPIFESLQLHYASEKLFATNVTFKNILLQAPKRLWRDMLTKLTIRRPSLSRSFDLSVGELENLKGVQRNKRLNVLQRSASSAAIWLTIVGITIEQILIVAFCSLAWMLIPPQLDIYIDFWDLITNAKVHQILSWCWYLAMALVAPFYLASGFSLYINRRTILEGWDIELSFKDMVSRAKKEQHHVRLNLSPIIFFTIALLAFASTLPTNLYANATEYTSSNDENLGELVPDLTPEAAQKRMIFIMESDVFNDIRVTENWKFIDQDSEKDEDEDEESEMPEWLAELINFLAQGVEVLLWGVVIICVIFIALRLRGIEVPFLEAKKYATAPPPSSLFGLELSQDSLPDDIIGTARKWWRKSPRQAYSLLYRAALSDLVHAESLALQGSHTEGECVRLFKQLSQHNSKSQFFQVLTDQWVMLAYGHQRVSHKQFEALCVEWIQFFPTNTPDIGAEKG